MSYAALNAARVYEACQKALQTRQDPDRREDPEAIASLGRLGDLAYHVACVNGDGANIFVSAEDFALIDGHWPERQVEAPG